MYQGTSCAGAVRVLCGSGRCLTCGSDSWVTVSVSADEPMGWKATGQPTVRKQRDKWVVRVDGIDTETGMHRPRQLGTYASQRSALTAEADQGGRSCCPAPMPSGWLAVPGGRAVGQTPVILAGFDRGTKMAGSAGAGTSKIRRVAQPRNGIGANRRRAVASIARGIMVRWPLVQAGYVVDLIPSG